MVSSYKIGIANLKVDSNLKELSLTLKLVTFFRF